MSQVRRLCTGHNPPLLYHTLVIRLKKFPFNKWIDIFPSVCTFVNGNSSYEQIPSHFYMNLSWPLVVRDGTIRLHVRQQKQLLWTDSFLHFYESQLALAESCVLWVRDMPPGKRHYYLNLKVIQQASTYYLAQVLWLLSWTVSSFQVKWCCTCNCNYIHSHSIWPLCVWYMMPSSLFK